MSAYELHAEANRRISLASSQPRPAAVWFHFPSSPRRRGSRAGDGWSNAAGGSIDMSSWIPACAGMTANMKRRKAWRRA